MARGIETGLRNTYHTKKSTVGRYLQLDKVFNMYTEKQQYFGNLSIFSDDLP